MAVENKTRISKLLEQSSPIICGPKLLKEIGRAPVTFLQKLHYWLTTEGDHIGHFVDNRRWIYNTYEDWAEPLGIYCSTTIARAVRKLEKLGIISTRKFRSRKGDHQKAYTINYDVLNTLFPWLTQETSDVDISKKEEDHQDSIQENGQIEKEQNVLFIYGKHRCTKILSITSGEEVANKSVKQPPTPETSRREKISKPEIKESRLTEANQVIYKLLEIYNKHIGIEKITLNKRLAKWLMAAFQKLGSCLKKWENFCKQIASSDWPMGRVTDGFKASLSWLLRFEIMDRVLAGGFKCKEPYEDESISTEEDEQEIIKQIENSELSSEEQSVKKALLKTFGVAQFKSYFAQVRVKVEQEKVVILVKSLFHRDQIDTPSIWGKIRDLYPNVVLKV